MRTRLSQEPIRDLMSALNTFRLGRPVALKEYQRLLGRIATAASVSPRSAVYAPPPDMAEDTGAKKGVENGPCPCCGHSQVLERAEIMAEPRPVPTRRPDGNGHAAESGHSVSTMGWGAHCNGVPASVYWTVGETVAH